MEPLTSPLPAADDPVATAEPASWPDAIEVNRVVSSLALPDRAGQRVAFWIDANHRAPEYWRVADQDRVPSRLSEVDLAHQQQLGTQAAAVKLALESFCGVLRSVA